MQISRRTHLALGPLLRLNWGDDYADLLPAEAQTFARALDAVMTGASTEREIYLSPLASDRDLSAERILQGVRLWGRVLDWADVVRLRDGLLDFADQAAR